MIDSRLAASGWSTWFARQVLSPVVYLGGRPWLAASGRSLGVDDALVCPALCEPVVVDPPGYPVE